MSVPAISERVLINGCYQFVSRRGKGPPLIALHGGPGLDQTTLSGGFVLLERSFEVIYLDFRGHGRSDRCPPEELTFQQLVDDVEELRHQLGHSRVHLLGHSMGARIALLYALKFPRRLETLVLESSSAAPPQFARRFLGARGRYRARFQLVRWAIGAALSNLRRKPWSPEETWRRFWTHCWPLYAPRQDAWPGLPECLLESLKPPLSAIPPLMVELNALDLSRVLDQVQVRTLIVCGAEDTLFADDQHHLQRIPSAQVALLPGVGHFPHLDAPALFAETVRNFLLNIRLLETLEAWPAIPPPSTSGR